MILFGRRLKYLFYRLFIIISGVCFMLFAFRLMNFSHYRNELVSLLNIIESITTHREESSSIVLGRVLYLFLCENQAEADVYLQTFPTVTADILLYCWREKCSYSTTHPQLKLFVSPWSSNYDRAIHLKNGQKKQFSRKTSTIIRTKPSIDFYPVTTQVFIINEVELNLTKKSTWATARNRMLERAKEEERKQAWKWAYMNFGDGDVHFSCPLAQHLLNNTFENVNFLDEYVLSRQYRSLMNLSVNGILYSAETPCMVLFDTFLLTVAPAIGYASGAYIPIVSSGIQAQIVYQIDAMFNAFHHDAIDLLLPYCSRFDETAWWSSQVVLVYRSLCLFGHAIQFGAVSASQQKHRAYPKVGDPWKPVRDAMEMENLHIFPKYLQPLFSYINATQMISVLILHHYSGWDLSLTSSECQKHNTINVTTCAVYHQPLL